MSLALAMTLGITGGGVYPPPPVASSLTISYFSTPASATASVNVTNIQAAIDAGQHIIFTLSDEYTVDANIEIGSNQTLDLGSATITATTGDRRIITNKGRPSTGTGGEGGTDAGDVNITLLNGTINGENTSSGAWNVGFYDVVGVTVRGVNSINANVHGIGIDDCTSVVCNNNTIDGVGDDAITLHRCTFGKVNYNTCKNGDSSQGGSHGIEIEDGNSHIECNYNTISNFVDHPAPRYGGGILVDASAVQTANSAITLKGNSITGCGLNGITINDDNGGSTNNIRVLSNTVTNSGRPANIRVEGASDVLVQSNTCDGNTADGATGSYNITVSDATNFRVLGNTCKHAETHGIYIQSDSCSGYSISSNTVDSCAVSGTFNAAIKIHTTSQQDIYAEIHSNAITNVDGNAQMRVGIDIDATYLTDYWSLKDNSVDNSETTEANAYIYPASANTTVSNNTGGEAGDL